MSEMVERVKKVLYEHGLDAVSEATLTSAALAAIEAMPMGWRQKNSQTVTPGAWNMYEMTPGNGNGVIIYCGDKEYVVPAPD